MTVGTPRGRVVRDEQGVRVEFVRSWPVPVEDVWDAIADPGRCARWYGRWAGDPSTGSVRITMSAEDGAPSETLAIEECAPPHRLVVRTTPPGEDVWRLELTLTSEGAGTTMRFVHRLVEPYDATGIGPGWHFYVDRLEAEIARRHVDQEWDDYVALGPEYALT